VHGRQRRCQEDPVSLPSGRLEKTTRSSPHHVAQHRPTGSKTTPPYAPRSSRFGSEPPSVEDDVDVWCYAIVRVACQKRRRRRQFATIQLICVSEICTLHMHITIVLANFVQNAKTVRHIAHAPKKCSKTVTGNIFHTSISKLPSESSRKWTRQRISFPGGQMPLYSSDSRTLYEPLDTFSFIDILPVDTQVDTTHHQHHYKYRNK